MDFILNNLTEGIDSQFLIKNGSLLLGAAACTYLGLQALKSNIDYVTLRNHIDVNDLNILKASEWIDVCFRLEEFSKLSPKRFMGVIRCVLIYIKFKNTEYIEKKQNKNKIKLLPRLARKYLHPIIEAVRYMRADLQENYSEYIHDFDDIAADIQTIHDSCATNIFLDTL